MVKRGMAIILFCLCLSVFSCTAFAASTTDAKEPISIDRDCTLTISYGYDGTIFADQTVDLYKVADVSADFRYSLTEAFASSGLILNGVQTQGEWNVIRSTLGVHILANNTAPVQTSQTDALGQACFTQLTPGLYLASALNIVQENLTCCFDSVLVALPGLGAEGLWQYQVSVTAKPQVLPPITPDEEIQLKVIKLWRGDEGSSERPQSVEVDLFRDGVKCETVILSQENHWSYSWSAKKDGARWSVVERNVPNGYVMTVEERENSFTLTNTKISDTPIDPPPTGDTSNILLYVVLMLLSGVVLLMIGVVGKRRSYEKAQ